MLQAVSSAALGAPRRIAAPASRALARQPSLPPCRRCSARAVAARAVVQQPQPGSSSSSSSSSGGSSAPEPQLQQQQPLGADPAALLRLQLAAVLVARVKCTLRALGQWCTRHRLPQLLLGSDASQAVAAMSLVPVLPGGGFSDLFTNRVFLAGFWAWFTAQTLKIFTKRLKKGVWDIKAIVDSGGMPSSHSALCAGITTAIAYQHGLGSSAFALALALSSIVMYDAAGVRRHAGKQAEVLNQVIGELLEGHPVSDVKLKEVLGHTPLQVCAGAVLGVLFGIFFPMLQPPTLLAAA